jgi:hypothetical protein
MRLSHEPSELERGRIIADLHELIAALDRRAPRADREAERRVAREAKALRGHARLRLDALCGAGTGAR